MSTALIVVLVVLVLAGLGVGGYFLYQKLTEKKTGSDKEKVEKAEKAPEEEVTEEKKGKKTK